MDHNQHIQQVADYLEEVQSEAGDIAWFSQGHLDPWDHIESAMALSIAGRHQAAELAYQWLADSQRENGSWAIRYRDGQVEDDSRIESNFVAYIAVGIWHHYLITQSDSFLDKFTPVVQRAINFILPLQTAWGEFDWAVAGDGSRMPDALITGCSSIYKSLRCAAKLYQSAGIDSSQVTTAADQLQMALAEKPERFDRSWEAKTRFSMDWFYPVLSGAVQGDQAIDRIDQRWDEFVEEGLGCRCVSDEPWVTMAESAELVMALVNINRLDTAKRVLEWLHDHQLRPGVYQTGWQFKDQCYWPDEQPTWTSAAIVLAIDCVFQLTPAAQVFNLRHSASSV